MLEGIFSVPHFEEAKTLEELNSQMAVVSELIERCEKMLQSLALGNYRSDPEFDSYMTSHIQLIGLKNKLTKKWEKMVHTNNQT